MKLSEWKKINSKRIIWVKKNLIDPTAALSYSLGASIVHLALAFTILFIKNVDMTAAEGLHKECVKEANNYRMAIIYFKVTHVISFITCIYREVYSSKTSLFAQLLRIFEVICIPFYIASIFMALELITIAIIRQHTQNPIANDGPMTEE